MNTPRWVGVALLVAFVLGCLLGAINLGWWMSNSPVGLLVCLVVLGCVIGRLFSARTEGS